MMITKNTKASLVLITLLFIAACGGDDSTGGTGDVADRVNLVGATSSSTSSSNSNSIESTGQGFTAMQAVAEEEACEGGGTFTLDLTFDVEVGSGENEYLTTLSMTGTAADCGPEEFTGSLTMDGSITTNLATSASNGTFNIDVTGSTTRCSALTADLTETLAMTGETGTITLNGTLTGTCTGGEASCTFENVELSTEDTEAEMQQKLCTACDVPAESCT